MLTLAATTLPVVPSRAQDARELEQERAASKKLKGEHPLIELMRTRKSASAARIVGRSSARLSLPIRSSLNCAARSHFAP